MTHDDDDERLDALLNQWSNQTTSSDRLERLHERMVSSLSGPPSGADDRASHVGEMMRHVEQPAATRHRRDFNRWIPGIACAITAALLVSGGVFHLWIPLPDDSIPMVEFPSDYIWLQEDQLLGKAKLLSAMEDLFDGRVAWVAETSDRIEFELQEPSASSAAQPTDDHRLAIRFVVQRRVGESLDWETASAWDVVTRSEEVVRITSKENNGNTLLLWAFRLPDGMIAIDSEFHLHGGDITPFQSSSLQKDRQQVQIADQRSPESEFRVFQTVSVLDVEVI